MGFSQVFSKISVLKCLMKFELLEAYNFTERGMCGGDIILYSFIKCFKITVSKLLLNVCRVVSRTLSNIYDWRFYENSLRQVPKCSPETVTRGVL